MNFLLKWSRCFDSLTFRERFLVALTTLVFVLLPGYVIFIEPTLIRQASNQIKIDRLQQANNERRQDISILQNQVSNTINDQLTAELSRLQQELASLNAEDADNNLLLSPSQANAALTLLLDSAEKLRLLGFEKIAASPVVVSKIHQAHQAAGLYRHPIELSVEGSTEALIDFVTSIEDHPLPLFVESIQWTYGKQDSQLYLRLYSYGLYPSWLGGGA